MEQTTKEEFERYHNQLLEGIANNDPTKIAYSLVDILEMGMDTIWKIRPRYDHELVERLTDYIKSNAETPEDLLELIDKFDGALEETKESNFYNQPYLMSPCSPIIKNLGIANVVETMDKKGKNYHCLIEAMIECEQFEEGDLIKLYSELQDRNFKVYDETFEDFASSACLDKDFDFFYKLTEYED